MAQIYIGIDGGVSKNHLQTNISNRTSTILGNKDGIGLGIPVEMYLCPWLSIQATPSFLQKNYRMDRTDSLSGIYYQYNNNYIQLPVLLKLHYGKKIQISGGGGGYIGYWMRGKISGRMPDIYSATSSGSSQSFDLVAFQSPYEFSKKRDKRQEFGWTADIGLDYPIKQNYLLFLHLNQYYALTDQQKNYQHGHIPQYNYTTTLYFGISYKLQ